MTEALGRVHIVQGDAFALAGSNYDLASMHFVAESVTEDPHEFDEFCAAFVATVPAGGHLVAAFMENMGRYELGDGSRWPGIPVGATWPGVRPAHRGSPDLADRRRPGSARVRLHRDGVDARPTAGRSDAMTYFERVSRSAFRATSHVGGAWDPDKQHVAPAWACSYTSSSSTGTPAAPTGWFSPG